jgi:hypothetical protein
VKDFPTKLLQLLSVTALAPALCAQTAPVSSPAPPSPPRVGRVSSAISAAISASLPPFAPVKVVPEKLGVTDETVIRMAEFVVTAPTLHLTDRETLNKLGLEQLLRQRYPGASFKGQDPYRSALPNYAALMYRDDIRLSRMNDLKQFSATLRAMGMTSDAKKLDKEIQHTFIRRPSWRDEGMDKSYNNGRR